MLETIVNIIGIFLFLLVIGVCSIFLIAGSGKKERVISKSVTYYSVSWEEWDAMQLHDIQPAFRKQLRKIS